MFRRYRRRHGYSEKSHTLLRYIVLGVLCGTLVFTGGKKIASLLGQIGDTQVVAALLHVPERSSVQVSLDGGEAQRAENGLRLYPGDRLTVGSNAQGFVTFFDGTIVALDQNTEFIIDESLRGESSSTIDMSLTKGNLWIKTPSADVYTGSIVRSVHTPAFLVAISSRTDGLIGERMLQFFTTDGLGGRIEIPGISAVGYVGEGQQFFLPEGKDIREDLYLYRSPLEDSAFTHTLVLAGKDFAQSNDDTEVPKQKDEQTEGSVSSDEILTVTSPLNNATVAGDILEVQGVVGKAVRRIRINGYMVDVNPEDSAFTYELTLPRDAEVSVVIEALDEKGIPLIGIQRIIQRDIDAPIPPIILLPSGSGTTYRTQKTEFEIRGSAPPDAVGIVVNDYRLQLFVQGDSQWSYLASRELGNLEYGQNVYDVRAIDTSGNISSPARITILLEEGEEGVVIEKSDAVLVETETVSPSTEDGEGDSKTKEQKPVSATLPENLPIMPGSLKIVGPTVGEPFTATGSEFSIYGVTPEETYSVWVNGYRLRLYTPGDPVWKYIASYPLGTMKRGKNVYAVAIRNRVGEVLDRLEYTVYYRVE
ncbi:hypothetical protein HYZ98_02915 [Candidatus Peregrinibacteria bacterium]|nr:hypothetical protein [Candidatus Peregrinibacteria bacterium]